MTRGKHGQSAETRRRIEEAEKRAQLAEALNADLSAENAQLKARALDREQAHRAEVKRLKAERNQGVSPMLGVVEAENARLRTERDSARKQADKTQATWTRVFSRVQEHFIAEHGLTRLEGLEAAASMATIDGHEFTIANNAEIRFAGARPTEQDYKGLNGDGLEGDASTEAVDRVRLLQKIRGERR